MVSGRRSELSAVLVYAGMTGSKGVRYEGERQRPGGVWDYYALMFPCRALLPVRHVRVSSVLRGHICIGQ